MRFNILLLCGWMLISLTTIAQNPNLDFKLAAKLGNQVTYEYGTLGYEDRVAHWQHLQTVHAVPSVIWKGKKGLFNEVSLMKANFEETKGERVFDPTTWPHNDNPHRLLNADFAVRYGKFFPFLRKKDCRWVPMLGVELTGRFSHVIQAPNFFNYNVFQQSRGDVVGYLTPRLAWFASKRLFMDLSLQAQCFDLLFLRNKELNNNIANLVQVHHGSQINFLLPVFTGTLAVGYKF